MEKKNKKRCGWVDLNDPLYMQYHDLEWGIPVKEDLQLFAMLNLEGAQAGLSWKTVLHKRENYLKVFSNFEPKKLVKYSKEKREKLLEDPGIIRNRLKVNAVFTNAENYLKYFPHKGDFSNYIWSFVNHHPIENKFKSLKEIPAKTKISDELSKDLKKKGFKFIGSTICYAFMQAVGMVNDHELTCDYY